MTAVALDASRLPSSAMDHRAPIWWGNLLLLAIESTMFGLLLAAYFYVWQNFSEWPPPQTNRSPVEYHPLPYPGLATTILIMLLASVAPMLYASRECLRMNLSGVRLGMVATVVLGLLLIGMEYHNLTTSTRFKWSDNAYASVVWALLGLHLAHMIVVTTENGLMLAWLLLEGLDRKHARDIRVTAVYWYWVVGVWAILYAVIYWAPRVV
jgi:heme/copper-type cytochrome/quinol oxidase subunit 3